MNEPVHPNESRFWDQVADWVLLARMQLRRPPRPEGGRPATRPMPRPLGPSPGHP